MPPRGPKDYLELARSADATPEQLDQLATSEYLFVVEAVAENPHTPPPTLRRLLPTAVETKAQQRIAGALVGNPSVPVAVLTQLAELIRGRLDSEGAAGIGCALCCRSDIPVEPLLGLLVDPSAAKDFRMWVGRSTPRLDLLEVLSSDPNDLVRRMVAKNPSYPGRLDPEALAALGRVAVLPGRVSDEAVREWSDSLPASPIPWSELGPVFTLVNDCFRDIIIVDADPKTQQRTYDYVLGLGRSGIARVETEAGGDPEPFPPTIAEVEALRDDFGYVLIKIFIGPVWINWHFFGGDRLELDMDPRDVKTEGDALGLMRFLRGVAIATDRPVHLTQESSNDAWWLTFDPASKAWVLDDWEFDPDGPTRHEERTSHQRTFRED